MRPTKCRVWHKVIKEMFTVAHLQFGIDGLVKVETGSISDENWKIEDIELMWFIGLLDRKKRDIYEGDILKMQDATAKVVFWGKPPEFGLDYYHNEDEWCEDWNLSDDSTRMEIIGNIYEHPELMSHA